MSRKARSKDEDFGLKKSSGVNYGQVLDRQIDDDRFERQRAIRVGAAPVRFQLLLLRSWSEHIDTGWTLAHRLRALVALCSDGVCL